MGGGVGAFVCLGGGVGSFLFFSFLFTLEEGNIKENGSYVWSLFLFFSINFFKNILSFLYRSPFLGGFGAQIVLFFFFLGNFNFFLKFYFYLK